MSLPDNPVDAAARRLAEALNRLEQRIASAPAATDDLFADDRASLRSELERERARVRELEAVAGEASAALGRAAVEIRAAVGEPANEDS